VPNSGATEIHRRLYGIRQIFYPSQPLQNNEFVGAQTGDPGGIVPPIFHPLKAIDQNLGNVFSADVTYNTAHGCLCLLRTNVLREKSFQKMVRHYLILMHRFITVAIDGAAASGKTSTALRLSEKYGMLMSSTGLYYRAFTLKMLNCSIGSDDTEAVKDFLRTTTLGSNIYENTTHITINGELFANSDLRSQAVNGAVSRYSAIPAVREFLLDYQRSQVDIARERGFSGLAMEGRDITSVILPDADLKFFLSASVGERSRRRENDSESDCVSERDRLDGGRTICTDGVRRIDTTANDLNAVVGMISTEIDKILNG
jgi:cytidylate kinase